MSRGPHGLPLVGRRTVRRRRPRPMVWLALGVGKVLLGVAPVVAVGVWLATAPVFDLKPGVEIETGENVPEDWVRNRLAGLVGRNLPLLSLERASRRLEHDWVREARLIKRLPNELKVQIVEHEPVAVFESGDRSWIIDRDGRAIVGCEAASDLCGAPPEVPLSGDRPDGTEDEVGRPDAALPGPGAGGRSPLVRVSIQSVLVGERVSLGPARNRGAAGRGSRDVTGEVLARTLKRAVAVASDVRAFEWGREVFAVEVLSDDDYLLARSGRPPTVLVRGSDLTVKGSVFELLRAAIREHSDPDVVDLRFRDRVVLSMDAPDAGPALSDGSGAGDPS